jgi:predicted nucleic acid-binding protein
VILVDSSVWIDYFRGIKTAASDELNRQISGRRLAVGDLIVVEVLQGFADQREFNDAKRLLGLVDFVEIGGWPVAVQAAEHYRFLRSLGVTVRKTIDVLIATRCIMSGLELLHSDRDFDPFVKHLGLKSIL